MSARDPAIRILHVVGCMDRAGVETWLMHVLRNMDRERYRMDFLVQSDQPASYDEEIRSYGARVIPCPHPHRPWIYAPRLQSVLRQEGPYDVVHSHIHHYSGIVLRLSKAAGVPVRIAHSHLDSRPVDQTATALRKLYLRTARSWIHRYATCGLSASRLAASALFGPAAESDPRWRVLSYGADFSAFHTPADRLETLSEFGIAGDAFVIGHVGRMVPQKNHEMLLRIAAEVCRREPRARFLLVGTGPLRKRLESQVEAAGMRDFVRFAGVRSDVARLMTGAMDAFLFPSHFEGLGLVLVESQAAGLPIVCSSTIPQEADVVPGMIRRLSLEDSTETWAQAVLDLASAKPPVARSEALRRVEHSAFSLQRCVAELEVLYRNSRVKAS